MTTGAAAGGLPEKTVHRRDQSMNKTSHPILSMVVSRVGLGLLSLLIVSLVIFFSVSLLPGSYASAILGQNATPEAVAAPLRVTVFWVDVPKMASLPSVQTP